MTEPLTVARPYGRAVFEVASSLKTFSQWESFLSVLAALLGESRVQAWLEEPSLDVQKKSAGLLKVLGQEFEDSSIQNFLNLLIEKKRIALVPEILFVFRSLKAEFERKVPALVKSAYPLSETDIERVAGVLEKKFNRTVEILLEVDEALLGGLLIESGDFVLDHSIRGRIERLSEAL